MFPLTTKIGTHLTPDNAADRHLKRSNGLPLDDTRPSRCALYSRTCIGSTMRPRRSSTRLSTPCRPLEPCCSLRFAPSTSTVGEARPTTVRYGSIHYPRTARRPCYRISLGLHST